MNRTVLQIPIAPLLRQQAEAVSLDLGFSSLQDAVRLLLHKLARRELSLAVHEEKSEPLSKKAAARYDEMYEDFKHNRNVYHAKDVDDLLRQLRS
ncbi:MAG: hypothetical protein AAB800_01655 [Patescibacteria group bacterium]